MNKLLRALKKRLVKPHKPSEFGFKKYSWFEFTGTDDEKDFLDQWRMKYPINYLYNRKLKHIPSKIKRGIDDAVYCVQCHIYPSYRWHLIDIRQPKDSGWDNYRWGFRDTDFRLVLANFSLFMEFVEKELDVKTEKDWENHFFTDEYIANEEESGHKCLLDHNECMNECRELWRYWTIGRKDEMKRVDDTLSAWYRRRNKKGDDERFKIHREMEEQFYRHEEEMLIRLIKVRRFLWT